MDGGKAPYLADLVMCGQLHNSAVLLPGTHYTGGWVGLNASSDAVAKREIPEVVHT